MESFSRVTRIGPNVTFSIARDTVRDSVQRPPFARKRLAGSTSSVLRWRSAMFGAIASSARLDYCPRLATLPASAAPLEGGDGRPRHSHGVKLCTLDVARVTQQLFDARIEPLAIE